MVNQSNSTVAVLGAGSWGTALAIALSRNQIPVNLWDRDAEHIQRIASSAVNQRYVPDIPLSPLITPLADFETAIRNTDYILVVVPSSGFRVTLKHIKQALNDKPRVAWASKGLEPDSGKFLHQIAQEELGADSQTATISGPSFALEVARGLPTAVTVASGDTDFAGRVAASLHSDTFRTYTSNDVIGVELGGAVKNVLAIAAGIADGLGFGANTRAALITRGLAEIMRLGVALGGKPETFMGLTGVGDLVLTCTDDQSRNRRLGLALGRGDSLEAAMTHIGQAVEGVHTAREVMRLARRHGIDMPIVEQVDRVLYHGVAPDQAVRSLLARDPKAETF